MHGKINYWNRIRVFFVVSALLILAVMTVGSYMLTNHEKEIMGNLSFECDVDGRKIELGVWENEEEEIYYLFLPSCFAGKNREYVLRYEDKKGTLKIDGISYKDGQVFEETGNETTHQIELKSFFGTSYMEKQLRILTSENLPAIMITVEAEEDLLDSEEFSNKKYIETGDMIMLSEEGDILCSERLDKFKVRGNLTATLDKKPFTFSFSQPISLCGMKPAVKWNLLANATDGSYIRNKVVLDLANASIDAYEPDGEFTELYLNGQYQGLYLLTEAVEIGENRLDLLPEDSWFVEMELDFRLEEDTPYVVTDKGQIFIIHSETGITEKEKEQILYMLNDIESALFAQDGISLLSGKELGELIDLESWAEAWLVQEISGDHDTGIASQFAYTLGKEDSLLYAGPVWDFDGTMGNVNTPMFKNPAALTTSIEESRPYGNANQNRWLAAMYRNDDFKKVVEEKYISTFRGYLEEILDIKINAYIQKIGRSTTLDAFKWHEKRLEWIFVLPENFELSGDDYRQYSALQSHVDMVKDYLTKKKEFLDKLWIEHVDFCVVEVRNDLPILNQDYNQTLYFWVEQGTEISGLPYYETEEGNPVSYVDMNTGEMVFDGTVIWEDRVLEAVFK